MCAVYDALVSCLCLDQVSLQVIMFACLLFVVCLSVCLFASVICSMTAHVALGVQYYNGRGCKKDEKKALSLFKTGAEAGIIDGSFYYGYVCTKLACEDQLSIFIVAVVIYN